MGAQTVQNVVVVGPWVGQAGHGPDQHSESLCVEGKSSGKQKFGRSISTRESWVDSPGLPVQAGQLKARKGTPLGH